MNKREREDGGRSVTNRKSEKAQERTNKLTK